MYELISKKVRGGFSSLEHIEQLIICFLFMHSYGINYEKERMIIICTTSN